ncbi:uncharacterized protein [Argopecten irradians]|uniref:uncharacterized protein n=1 Tax=Argopecten irradians TaxID=31199 RepID=UPI0037227054
MSLNLDVDMAQLTERMAGLTQTEQNQNMPTDQNIAQDDSEVVFRNMAQHFKNFSAAMTAQGVFQVVRSFEGDPTKFKTWIKEIEKYAKLVGLDDKEIPKIAYQTSVGSVGDFIKRYLDDLEGDLSWEDLKKLLKQRFADITDSHQAMALLRKTIQKRDESVQIYAERLLQVAEDAYPDAQECEKGIVQRQLVNAFCDGLHFDYVKMKVMREDPDTLERAVHIAMREQNLRKRFNLRQDMNNDNDMVLRPRQEHVYDPQVAPTQDTYFNLRHNETNTRREVPMDIDHTRQRQCYKCKQNNIIRHRPRPVQDRNSFRETQRQTPLNRAPRNRYSDNSRYHNQTQNRSYSTGNRVQPQNPPTSAVIRSK